MNIQSPKTTDKEQLILFFLGMAIGAVFYFTAKHFFI